MHRILLSTNTRPLSLPSISCHATSVHSREVMKTCLRTSRIPILQPWDHRGLRTSTRIVSRKPAVKRLSNTELLEIICQDKEDSTSIKTAQNEPDELDSQEHDIHPRTASLLATPIHRLPQSPLTHQGLVAARIRHREVKLLPSRDRSLFQSKLQKNPYGIHALICGTES